jgi:hypothetical protein
MVSVNGMAAPSYSVALLLVPARLQPDDLSGTYLLQRFESVRNQGQKVIDAIGPSHQDHQWDVVLSQILLMLEILVCCQEGVELALGEGQQITVRLACPPSFLNSHHLVAAQMSPELPW